MLALSIRQPYAELILRGLKTIEGTNRDKGTNRDNRLFSCGNQRLPLFFFQTPLN